MDQWSCTLASITGTCGYSYLGNTVKMRVSSISGRNVTFEVQKCDGSNFASGTKIYLKESNSTSQTEIVCGTEILITNNAGGKSSFSKTVSVNHSGRMNYVAVAIGSTDRYRSNIVAIDANGDTNQAPTKPTNPNPGNGATGVSTSPTFSWNSTDPEGGQLLYRLYLGETENSLPLGANGTGTSTAGKSFTLQGGKIYYWRVDSYDEEDKVGISPVWHFTTVGQSSGGNCSFPDLSNTSNLYEATCYLYTKNVVTGINGYMQTESLITRLHTAKIAFKGVYTVKGRTVPSSVRADNYPSIYSDLNINTAGNDLQAAKALLYLEYDDGISPFDRNRASFNHDANITRADVLKVLLETFNIKPDISSTASYSDESVNNLKNNNPLKFGYIYKAKNLGIIDDINTFRPFDNCKRGEAFLMLYRIMTKVDAGNITDPNPSGAHYFEPLNITLQNISVGLNAEAGVFKYEPNESFNLSGVVPLNFNFSYNSYNSDLPDEFFGMYDKGQGKIITYQPLGRGWSHNYHSFITVINPDGSISQNSRAILHWGGGTIHVYKSNGTKLVPESYGVYDDFDISGSVVTITTKSQTKYRFKKHGASHIMELETVTDRNGNQLTINYETGTDGVARISSVSDGKRQLTFEYRTDNNILKRVTDPLGRKIEFQHSLDSNTGQYEILYASHISFSNPSWLTTRYAYYSSQLNPRADGLLAAIKLPKGNYIQSNYDNNRRLTTIVTKDINDVIRSRIDVAVATSYASNNKSISSDVKIFYNNGNSSANYGNSFTFNPNNRPSQITGNLGYQVDATYNNSAHPTLPTSVSTNNSNIQNIRYDDRGNATQITVKSLTGTATRTVSISYNADNTVSSVTDPKGNKMNYFYDSKGNLTSISAPENTTTGISVNSKGLPTSVTNPSSIVTEYDYNTYGNLRTTTIPSLSISATINYDEASRITSVLDFLNRTTSFTYDNNDNVLTETDALNRTTNYAYDLNDNLTSITNAKGGVTTLTYDDISDWLTSVTFGVATKSYEYNDDGTMKKFTKPDGTNLQTGYDDLGRITNDGVNAYEYDNDHRLWKITKDGKTLTVSYDGFNQITGVAYDSQTVNYAYDANGNITSITYPGNKTVTYTYDDLNRMKTVKDWNNRTITYSYHKDSRVQSVAYPNGMTLTYAYDNAGRQTGKTMKRSDNSVIASYTFTLDKVGNILTETRTEPYADVQLPNENVSYAYNNANRITQAGNTSFTFDANGNTKTRGNSNYNYDKSDKLISGDGFNFEYDGLGNIRSNGNKRYMIDIMGMGNVIAETNMSGTTDAYYIYGLGLEARILSSGNTEYYVSDYRGSVVAMTDATTSANITHKYQYDDFGNITQSQENDVNPFRYVGKYGVMYANNNLYYMRARFYNPAIGRFLTEDPVWSTNLYPYADNNPIMGIDPQGLTVEIPTFVQAGMNTLTSPEFAIEFQQQTIEIYNELSQFAQQITPYAPIVPAAMKGAQIAAKEAAKGVIKLNSGLPLHGTTLVGGYLAEGAMVGAFLVGYSVGNAINAASNATNLTDFVNNMEKSGDPIYRVSLWMGDKMEQGFDATYRASQWMVGK
jgi:RHS repeat-associated protein